MRLQLPDSPLTLRQNAPLRLTGARGFEVVAVSGIVWLTAEADSDDVFLNPGERFRVANNGLVLVEAIGSASASIRLLGPRRRAASPVRLIAGRLAGGLRTRRQDRMHGSIPPACPDTA